jgi:hypothetical protein
LVRGRVQGSRSKVEGLKFKVEEGKKQQRKEKYNAEAQRRSGIREKRRNKSAAEGSASCEEEEGKEPEDSNDVGNASSWK